MAIMGAMNSQAASETHPMLKSPRTMSLEISAANPEMVSNPSGMKAVIQQGAGIIGTIPNAPASSTSETDLTTNNLWSRIADGY